MRMTLELELQLRSLLKDVYNKLDEAKTLVAAMMITSDYNVDDLTFIENTVHDALKKLEEAKALAEKLNVDDDEWEEYVEVG
jgi:DNA repair ATPase RecN